MLLEHKPGMFNHRWVAWKRMSIVDNTHRLRVSSVMCSGASERCILSITLLEKPVATRNRLDEGEQVPQRTGTLPGEKQEDPGLENTPQSQESPNAANNPSEQTSREDLS